MSCPQCQGIENLFDKGIAEGDLKTYRRKGPPRQTRYLLDFIRKTGVKGLTLLDIGGGIGAIQHELFKDGVQSAVDVDASSAYIAAAREEAVRQGYADHVTYLHGNFVDLAAQVERADIVTLDRVICCYPDMKALVGLSSARAGKLYGLIYPQDNILMRLGRYGLNFFMWLQRSKFRFFVHPSAEVDSIVHASGLQRRYHRNVGLVWQVVVYARS